MLRGSSKVGAGFGDNSGLKQDLYAKPAPTLYTITFIYSYSSNVGAGFGDNSGLKQDLYAKPVPTLYTIAFIYSYSSNLLKQALCATVVLEIFDYFHNEHFSQAIAIF